MAYKRTEKQISSAYHAAQCRKRPVEVGTVDDRVVRYDSVTSASIATGIPQSRISVICKKGGGYSKEYGFRFCGEVFPFKREEFGRSRGKGVIVTHNGIDRHFISLSIASDFTGVPANRICISCKHGKIVSGKYQFKYSEY